MASTTDRDFRMAQGMAYAWGRQDAERAPTLGATRDTAGSHEFATAYAQGWADYECGDRGNMTTLQAAYDAWQRTEGRTIFPVGDSTEDQRARRLAWGRQDAGATP